MEQQKLVDELDITGLCAAEARIRITRDGSNYDSSPDSHHDCSFLDVEVNDTCHRSMLLWVMNKISDLRRSDSHREADVWLEDEGRLELSWPEFHGVTLKIFHNEVGTKVAVGPYYDIDGSLEQPSLAYKVDDLNIKMSLDILLKGFRFAIVNGGAQVGKGEMKFVRSTSFFEHRLVSSFEESMLADIHEELQTAVPSVEQNMQFVDVDDNASLSEGVNLPSQAFVDIDDDVPLSKLMKIICPSQANPKEGFAGKVESRSRSPRKDRRSLRQFS